MQRPKKQFLYHQKTNKSRKKISRIKEVTMKDSAIIEDNNTSQNSLQFT